MADLHETRVVQRRRGHTERYDKVVATCTCGWTTSAVASSGSTYTQVSREAYAHRTQALAKEAAEQE